MLSRPDVVRRKIGENAALKMQIRHPLRFDPLGGHLHDHVGTAGILHRPQDPLQLVGLRRSVGEGKLLLPQKGPVGADEPRFMARRLQDPPEHVGRRGLSLGPRHRRHGPQGISVKSRCQRGECPPRGGYQQEGRLRLPSPGARKLLFQPPCLPVPLLHDHHGGPLFQGFPRKQVAVLPEPLQADEHVARLHLPGITGDPCHVRSGASPEPDISHMGQQTAQYHEFLRIKFSFLYFMRRARKCPL